MVGAGCPLRRYARLVGAPNNAPSLCSVAGLLLALALESAYEDILPLPLEIVNCIEAAFLFLAGLGFFAGQSGEGILYGRSSSPTRLRRVRLPGRARRLGCGAAYEDALALLPTEFGAQTFPSARERAERSSARP